MKRTFLVLASIALIAPFGSAAAHDGRIDDMGCHGNHPWAGYHCHQGPLTGQYFGSRDEAEREYRRYRAKSAPSLRGNPDFIIGRPRVIDGDTLEIRGKRISLFGVDAFERRQRCRRDNGRRYRCGRNAKYTLSDLVEDRRVACHKKVVSGARRTFATCWLGAQDLGASMVLSGWALADNKHSSHYVIHEVRAHRKRAGAWDGDFLRPAEWRQWRRKRRDRERSHGLPWHR